MLLTAAERQDVLAALSIYRKDVESDYQRAQADKTTSSIVQEERLKIIDRLRALSNKIRDMT